MKSLGLRMTIVLLATSTTGTGLLLVRTWRHATSCTTRAETLYRQARTCQQRGAELQQEVDSLKTLLVVSNARSAFGQHFVEPYVLEELGRHGVKNAPQSIIESLRSQWKLLPYNGAENPWPYKFYSERDIHVLSGNWVFARFDNGHSEGAALLEYVPSEKGKLRWRVLAAHLQE